MGHIFSLARCTVYRIVHDICRDIVKVLLLKYIHFPIGDCLKDTVQGFLDKLGIPQCVDQSMDLTFQFAQQPVPYRLL